MIKVRILDRCELCDENQLSSRSNQKKIQFEWIFEVSAAGLEPATNGLKGQRPNFLSTTKSLLFFMSPLDTLKTKLLE